MARPGSLRFVMGVLTEFTEKHVKIIALDAAANLREDTPRKTGWARANWIPSIGRPADLDGVARDPQPSEVQARGSQGEAGLIQIAAGYNLKLGAIYLTNNVPYIRRLNDGSSTQAPSGFVQAAILRAVRGAFRAGNQIL